MTVSFNYEPVIKKLLRVAKEAGSIVLYFVTLSNFNTYI